MLRIVSSGTTSSTVKIMLGINYHSCFVYSLSYIQRFATKIFVSSHHTHTGSHSETFTAAQFAKWIQNYVYLPHTTTMCSTQKFNFFECCNSSTITTNAQRNQILAKERQKKVCQSCSETLYATRLGRLDSH